MRSIFRKAFLISSCMCCSVASTESSAVRVINETPPDSLWFVSLGLRSAVPPRRYDWAHAATRACWDINKTQNFPLGRGAAELADAIKRSALADGTGYTAVLHVGFGSRGSEEIYWPSEGIYWHGGVQEFPLRTLKDIEEIDKKVVRILPTGRAILEEPADVDPAAAQRQYIPKPIQILKV